MTNKKKEGYWFWEHEPHYPLPVHSDISHLKKEDILDALLKIESNANYLICKGCSTCRCCGQTNGNLTYLHGEWEWPEGFSHYIAKHNIIPSEAFLKEVLGIEL